MKSILLVFLGGGLGSVCRYLLGIGLNNTNGLIPFGTLMANVIGSLLIGILLAYLLQNNDNSNIKLMAVAGFCGGFTTMSSFSAESVHFLQTGRYNQFFLYVALTLITCLGATMLGFKLFKA